MAYYPRRTKNLACNRQLIAFIVFFISRYDYQSILMILALLILPIKPILLASCNVTLVSEGTTEAVPPQIACIFMVLPIIATANEND